MKRRGITVRILLTALFMLAMMLGMSLTAYADNEFAQKSHTHGVVTRTTGDDSKAQLPRSYSLIYDSNGGSGTMKPEIVFEGDTFTFPECGFGSPKAKAFDYWEMSGVDGIFQPKMAVKIASNCADAKGIITVTAHWKDAAVVTTPPAAINPVYNGADQNLVTAGEAEYGTMNYALGKDDAKAPDSGWSEMIPQKTAAGTYYVWHKAVGTGAYGDSEPKCVTAKIKKADQAAPGAPAKDVVTTTSVTLTESAGCEYSIDAKAWQDSPEFNGLTPDTEYTFFQRLKEDANHNASQPSKAVKIRTNAAPKPEPGPKANKMSPKAMKAKGRTTLVLGWKKVNGAQGYDIFFSKCGKTKCKKVKTIKGNNTFSWTKTGLKTKTPYKAYVKAWVKKDGKKTYIATGPMVHSYTANGTKHYTNVKSIKVKKAKVTLKTGKTCKIKAKIIKVNRKKKLMPAGHTKQLRYMSTNNAIATVTTSGKIKGIKKGTCFVYVYAQNGVSKKVKVEVK